MISKEPWILVNPVFYAKDSGNPFPAEAADIFSQNLKENPAGYLAPTLGETIPAEVAHGAPSSHAVMAARETYSARNLTYVCQENFAQPGFGSGMSPIPASLTTVHPTPLIVKRYCAPPGMIFSRPARPDACVILSAIL